MMVFVDTSALYSFLDADDDSHGVVERAWRELLEADRVLCTTNYVLTETTVLLQSRLGLEAVSVLAQEVAPLLQVEWITEEQHEAALIAVLSANRRDLSLVDCVSFAAMRRLALRQALTVDQHFRDQGFEVLPPQT